MSGPFVGKIKIPNMDVNCALYLLQLSSAPKWKNRHLKQCTDDTFVAYGFLGS